MRLYPFMLGIFFFFNLDMLDAKSTLRSRSYVSFMKKIERVRQSKGPEAVKSFLQKNCKEANWVGCYLLGNLLFDDHKTEEAMAL